mmetsp:Transcript_40080/g.123662  ORF Transcript_40080/g.123662 Transcript_40080/m.123662 type:complete len:308 (-) Transcript_40080:82-1005(-)
MHRPTQHQHQHRHYHQQQPAKLQQSCTRGEKASFQSSTSPGRSTTCPAALPVPASRPLCPPVRVEDTDELPEERDVEGNVDPHSDEARAPAAEEVGADVGKCDAQHDQGGQELHNLEPRDPMLPWRRPPQHLEGVVGVHDHVHEGVAQQPNELQRASVLHPVPDHQRHQGVVVHVQPVERRLGPLGHREEGVNHLVVLADVEEVGPEVEPAPRTLSRHLTEHPFNVAFSLCPCDHLHEAPDEHDQRPDTQERVVEEKCPVQTQALFRYDPRQQRERDEVAQSGHHGNRARRKGCLGPVKVGVHASGQ